MAATGRSIELPSGAGHDAVTLSGLTDIAILFVRSTGGSHNPGEAVTEPDVALAIERRDEVRVLDLVVRGGHVVTPGGVVRADVGVGDGVIAEVAPELDGARVIDASACTSSRAGWTRTCTSTSPAARTGKDQDRQRRAGRGRLQRVLRHAAELDAADDGRAAFDAKLGRRGARLVRGFRAVGRVGAGRRRWRSWPSAA